MKIDKLTLEQESNLNKFRNECFEIVNCTLPANRIKAENAFKELYKIIGEKEPYIWWCDGPASGSIVRSVIGYGFFNNFNSFDYDNILSNVNNVFVSNILINIKNNIKNKLKKGKYLYSNIYSNSHLVFPYDNFPFDFIHKLRNKLHSKIDDNILNNFVVTYFQNALNSLRIRVVNDVVNNLTNNFTLANNFTFDFKNNINSVLNNIKVYKNDYADDIINNVGSDLQWLFWGQYGLYWTAYCLFLHLYVKPIHTEEQMHRLNLWYDIAKSCSFWMPFSDVVFACERPSKQSVDNEGRLHCEDDVALVYRDGWEVYSIHGVAVPSWIIEEKYKINPNNIEQEQNAEIRRIMIDFYGQSKYIQDSGAKLLHKDDYGSLYKKEIINDEPLVMVKVVNSTREHDGSYKDYWLRIPPNITTAREAVAWTFNKNNDDYNPKIQT